MDLPANYDELTRAQRRDVRNKYVELQGGKCHYCKCALDTSPPSSVLKKEIHKFLFPKGFFNWPVHLHHDHETGETIGAVHARCNAVLWEHHKQ